MKSALSLILLAYVAFLTACAGGSTKPAESDGRLQVQEISILKLDSLQAALPTAILIDVRSDEEWAAGHLAGASYVSFDWGHRKIDPSLCTAKREDEAESSQKNCAS